MPESHLPECVLPKGWGDCICDELRACERRVREDDKNTFLRAAYDTGREDGHECGTADGFAAGLSAARDAVAALRDENRQGTDPEWGVLNGALAAIDALRGDA